MKRLTKAELKKSISRMGTLNIARGKVPRYLRDRIDSMGRANRIELLELQYDIYRKVFES